MKKMVVLMVVFCSVALQGLAEFKMPASVYRMKQLRAARAEAKKKDRPISFIYTSEKTSCPLCTNASLKAARELGSLTIVVYADSDNERQLLPKIVQEALRKPEAGRFIPKTVIVDAELKNVIAVVPYARGNAQDILLKKAKIEISKALSERSTIKKPLAAIPPDESRELRVWKSQRGSQIKASLVREEGRYLVLKEEDGNMVKIPYNRLSYEDQKYIAELKKDLMKDTPRMDSPDRQ